MGLVPASPPPDQGASRPIASTHSQNHATQRCFACSPVHSFDPPLPCRRLSRFAPSKLPAINTRFRLPLARYHPAATSSLELVCPRRITAEGRRQQRVSSFKFEVHLSTNWLLSPPSSPAARVPILCRDSLSLLVLPGAPEAILSLFAFGPRGSYARSPNQSQTASSWGGVWTILNR
jgi:hypothetical protein